MTDESYPALIQISIQMMLFQNFPKLLIKKIGDVILKLPICYGIFPETLLSFEISLSFEEGL